MDQAAVFGALIFGGDGDDTITTSGKFGDLVLGGGGDDVITNKAGVDIIQAGDGDDVIIVAEPGDFIETGDPNNQTIYPVVLTVQPVTHFKSAQRGTATGQSLLFKRLIPNSLRSWDRKFKFFHVEHHFSGDGGHLHQLYKCHRRNRRIQDNT